MQKIVNQAATGQPAVTRIVSIEPFIPRSYHVLLVEMDTTEKHVIVSSPDVLNLKVCYVHCMTKEVKHATVFHLTGPITIHLLSAKKFPGYYYVCKWSERHHRYACSSLEGKQCGFCSHIDELAQLHPVA